MKKPIEPGCLAVLRPTEDAGIRIGYGQVQPFPTELLGTIVTVLAAAPPDSFFPLSKFWFVDSTAVSNYIRKLGIVRLRAAEDILYRIDDGGLSIKELCDERIENLDEEISHLEATLKRLP